MLQHAKLEPNQTTQPHHEQSTLRLALPIFIKTTLLSVFFATILLLITGFAVAGFAYYKINTYAQQAGTNISELKQLIETSLETKPKQTNGYKSILILGLDSVANKPNSPELTDTMLLVSLNLNSSNIRMISFPRDLWSSDYQTRINALYEYGKERYPNRPEQFPEEVISELTGVPIDHTITISLDTVAQIIDALGGIEVTVAQGFTDTEFPRDDIIPSQATSSADLYETVVFEQGIQTMDGATALKYIRSRKSADEQQGTDIARATRQQQVVSAIVQKATDFSLPYDVIATRFVALYQIYTSHFEQQLSLLEALATIRTVLPTLESLALETHSLSIYPEDEDGVITHPPLAKYNGQWVYEIRDLTAFQEEINAIIQK